MRAVVMGVAVAGVASFLVWSYLKRFEDEASGGPKVQVLTVVRTIEAGGTITDADIGERAIPQAYVDSRAIRAGDRVKITNLRVTTPLDAQQILNWSDIAYVNEEYLMSKLIQPPNRAVTIHTEGRGSALARPGDRVDVVATMQQTGNGDHRSAVTLFQNVLVLGRPLQSSNSLTGGPATQCDGMDIALSLSPQNAQLLALASDKAKLTITLRPGPDVGRVDVPEIDDRQIISPKAAPAAQAKPSGPQPVR